MMHYISEKGIYVNKMEDIRDLVSEDVYNAVEKIHEEEILELKDECKSGDEIIEEYEMRFEDCKSQLYEAQRIARILLDTVDGEKRLNRKVLRDLIIDLHRVIDNGIDA